MNKWIIALVLIFSTSAQAEYAMQIEKVADNVYAIVGELNQRSAENYANNATFGVIVSNQGVILVDSGGSYKGAQQIEKLIKTISDQPVKIVINTGGQDHRWWGNGYFKQKGAHIISSKTAFNDQKKRSSEQYRALNRFLGEHIKGSKAVYADETFDDSLELKFGGEKLILVYAGPAHTKGDIFVWMPDKKVMFSGDIVFTDRMLGPGPAADTASWLNVFETMVSYQPDIIVPGHGEPATLKKATQDTYDYIVYMRNQVSKILAEDGDMQDALKIDQSKFRYLKVFDKMAGRSAQSFFSQMEFE